MGLEGPKWTQVETKQTIISIIDLLDQRVFGKYHQQPYILHKLKMRKDLHENLSPSDVVCYTDYSKELEVLDQEQCKSSAFGASNVTIHLIGQIMELKVLAPSPPTLLDFDQHNQLLTFSKPDLDGGSNIQYYEVHIMAEDDESWFLLRTISFKMLSQNPDIPSSVFGRLL